MQYYVRNDGNDSNTGTTDSPEGAWKTAVHAFSVSAENGDIISIAIGVLFPLRRSESVKTIPMGEISIPRQFVYEDGVWNEGASAVEGGE